MNWFGIFFSGRGKQRAQREQSLARLTESSMGKLEKASAEQSEATASVKEAMTEQGNQSRALRRVIKGVVSLLQEREEKMNLRRDLI
jgi:hypothetical protein